MTTQTSAQEKTRPCRPRSMTLVHLSQGDFETAETSSFQPSDFRDGPLAAVAGGSRPATAELISAPVKASFPFDRLLAGASAVLGPEDRLELAAQVKGSGDWSPWFDFGSFTPAGGSASVKGQSHACGRMDTDVLSLAQKASYFRYRVTVRAAAGSKAFLRLVAVTVTDSSAPYRENCAAAAPSSARPLRLTVPAISQMAQQVEYSRDICSPSSVAMILNYFGRKAKVLDTAAGVYDSGENIYGNWTFNTMYAASRGLYAWPARLNSLEEARGYLEAGLPVAASLTFGPGELKGSPIKKTKGHLVVLKGFDAKGRVLVNDPAAAEERTVERAYDRVEFARAWLRNKFGTAYIIAPLERLPLTAKAPLAELFSKPMDFAKDDREKHIESQILPLESVTCADAEGGWLKVSADEQPHKDASGGKTFKPYQGWMEARLAAFRHPVAAGAVIKNKTAAIKDGPLAELSIGARVRVLAKEGGMTRIMLPGGDSALIAAKDLNSLPVPGKKEELRPRILAAARQFLGDRYYWGGRSGYGIDCSGLVNISYRAWGLD
ncbi:MAG: C39 family peptidase, partial [Elusimicrobiales bacterium]|nr:C39 family peptidase [Elusimicrobiales bacterium]